MLRKRRKTVQDLEDSESEEDLNISAVNSFENCIYTSTIEKCYFQSGSVTCIHTFLEYLESSMQTYLH